MADQGDIQQTMQAVMQAHEIVSRFHRNVADLFRSIIIDMEGRDVEYTTIDEDDDVLFSTPSPSLSKASRWLCKHVALPLQPEEDEDAPILLVHVAVDSSFANEPEIWLGSFSELRSFEGESFPYQDAVSYIFEDYFGPEEQWNQEGKWYEVSFEDDVVGATIGFCRLPLARLVDRDAVIREICDRLSERVDDCLDAQ